MPENKQSGRTIRGATTPTTTGSYDGATTPQLHGKGSNKTAEFLSAIDPNDPGAQGFYREALTIPHPLEPTKSITYGEVQQMMKGPQKAAVLEAYRAANRLPQAPTPAAYEQAVFDQAKQQLMERGAANPGVYAFPDAAVNALRAPTTARLIRSGNFAASEQPGQVVNPAMLAQRAAELPAEEVMAAPGVPVRLIRNPTPPVPTAPTPRTIRGSYASR
ncbi:hypothetical protein [Hymenobacter convexus]|uniref:hypothetical protein n=1 Tax=Hymenobacter sp. CA1UV-4 TaxID=3063782 RepID=UPI00271442D7|nr:hypothetical protein [Hymenobacter sp. CA1UV-4]MDO7852965.1 hypothetical protein [Hymenobacter sp. CA1UV-4]